MGTTLVATTRCVDYSEGAVREAIARQFELLGGIERFVKRGDSVLLKPNFIAPRAPEQNPAQTHPAVIIETAKLLKKRGAKPFVGDSPAWTNARSCAAALGLIESLSELDVPVRQLDRPQQCVLSRSGVKVRISSVALEADMIINLPKLKAHQQLVTTFAVKNMFGCVSGKQKALWHFLKGKSRDEFCELLLEICGLLKPSVTIVDGVVAMEGQGPIRGTARDLGWLIGGTDPVAVELICCELIGKKPSEMPMIEAARRVDSGCVDRNQITTAGDDIAGAACTDFRLAEPAPVRFSLPHVVRSVCKQIVMLARPRRA